MYNSAPEVDSDVNIPVSVLADVNRGMVELYNELLDEIGTVKLGLRIKDTSGEIICKIHTGYASLLLAGIICSFG